MKKSISRFITPSIIQGIFRGSRPFFGLLTLVWSMSFWHCSSNQKISSSLKNPSPSPKNQTYLQHTPSRTVFPPTPGDWQRVHPEIKNIPLQPSLSFQYKLDTNLRMHVLNLPLEKESPLHSKPWVDSALTYLFKVKATSISHDSGLIYKSPQSKFSRIYLGEKHSNIQSLSIYEEPNRWVLFAREFREPQKNLPPFYPFTLSIDPALNEVNSGQDNLASLYNAVGLFQVQDSNYIQASHFFKKAHDLAPHQPLFLENLVAMQEAQGQVLLGIDLLEKNGSLTKSSARLSGILGNLYEQTRQYEKAYTWSLRAFELDSQQIEWLINISDALWQLDQKLASKNILLQNPQFKNSFRYQVYLAGTYLGLEDYAASLRSLELAHSMEPPTTLSSEYMLVTLNGLGRYQDALAFTFKYPSGEKSDRWWFQKATAEFNLNRYTVAEKSLQKALKLSPYDGNIKTLLGKIQTILGVPSKVLLSNSISPVEKFEPPQLQSIINEELKKENQTQPQMLSMYSQLKLEEKKPWKKSTRIDFYVSSDSLFHRLPEWNIPINPNYSEISIHEITYLNENFKKISSENSKNSYLTLNHDPRIHPENLLVHIPFNPPKGTRLVSIFFTEKAKLEDQTIPYIEEGTYLRYTPMSHRLVIEGKRNQLNLVYKGNISVDSSDQRLQIDFKPGLAYGRMAYAPAYDEYGGLLLGSTKKTWTEVAQEYLDLISSHDRNWEDIKLPVKERLFALQQSIHYRKYPLETIFQYSRDSIEYQNFEFNLQALIPDAPADVDLKRNSDCKGHSLLLTQLLKAAGYKAYLALTHTERNNFEELPSIHQFNHMLTYLEVNGKTYLLDPTAKKAAFRPIPYWLEGKKVFILDPSNPRMIEAPRITTENENRFLLTRSIDSKFRYRLGLMMYGKANMDFREHLEKWREKGRMEVFSSWISSDLVQVEGEDLKILHEQDIDSPLVILFSSTLRRDQIQKQVDIGIPMGLEKSLLQYPQEENRQHPVYFPFPIKIQSSWKIFGGEFGLWERLAPKVMKKPLYVSAPFFDWSAKLEDNELMLSWQTEDFYASASKWQEIKPQWDKAWKEILGKLRGP